MSHVRNILFIMCDQLRADYLGCYGHPHLETPTLDALARDGVLFSSAFCNAPVCGPSRASFYTGRYPASHGATYNNFPLRLDEWTIGDYLGRHGLRTALVGKTHMKADRNGMTRLGIEPGCSLGVHLAQTGFEAFERDDGLHPQQHFDPDLAYNRYLRAAGYDSPNPWNDFANAALGKDGELLSGWLLRHARQPARVREEHSETAYMTRRAEQFIRDAGDHPWCLHLSYIKPHWPYMAPSPYHDMYTAEQVVPVNRAAAELDDANPVVAAFRRHREAVSFSRAETRDTVIPTYMGLVRQIDDQLGRLFEFLRASGRWSDTLIVFTSDHGDFLGDHWLGEKELFYEEALRIPLIVRDPSPAADPARGARREELVEAIDLLPTFLDAIGAPAVPERLEGRSLLPLLRSRETPANWRDAVFAEFDFSLRSARLHLGLAVDEARGVMVRTREQKYVHFPKHPPMYFDLGNDPLERSDLGRRASAGELDRMRSRLLDWYLLRRNRTTVDDATVAANTARALEQGFVFGVW